MLEKESLFIIHQKRRKKLLLEVMKKEAKIKRKRRS
jgi:hypothetical protein